jgi:hypothetical protein
MDKNAIEKRNKAWAKIVAKAWADEGFKKRLLQDAAAVFKAEGVELPANATIHVVEGKANEETLTLPPAPAGAAKIEKVEERLAAWSLFYQ